MNGFSLKVFSLFAVVGLAAASEPKFNAVSAPELDAFFQSTNGWVGADGAFSIPLSRNKTLWLFSDTWIGQVKDGKRVDVKMINNSIAVQRHGKAPQFFYRTNESGKAESFIKPLEPRGFQWLFAGTRTKQGVYFFLRHVEIVKPGEVFGFRGFDTSLAYVPNPDDPPHRWKVEQIKFPFEKRHDRELLIFGAAVMRDKGFVYIYGNSSEPQRRGMILARVPEKKFASFDDWQFFSNGQWTADFDSVSSICIDAPAEASVLWWPTLKKYVFVYAKGLGGQIVLRTADNPAGPWSDPTIIYECPEMKYPGKIFCYAGKAHPQLSTKRNELIVSYASNSYDVWEVFKDARLYWPRFVRVTVEK